MSTNIEKIDQAAEKAMNRLTIGDHEADAWGAVIAPYETLMEMVEEGASIDEIREEVEENQDFYQYAGFNAAYKELMRQHEAHE